MACSPRGPWPRSQDSSRGSHAPKGEDEKVVYRAKPGRCLEQMEREVSEMESATTGKLLTVGRNSSTGERGVRKRTRLVRRGAGGKGPHGQHLACCLPYYDLGEPLPDHSSLTRIRERYGVEVFRRFFDVIVEQ
jgi:hypothetical protein